MEIRSYRRVFDLERRIYRIDQVRLNPNGVPVRGVAYFVAIAALLLILERLPLVGALAAPIPWYLRDVGFPALGASLLTVTRVDGRRFDLAVAALLRDRLGARRFASLRPLGGGDAGASWRPQPLLMLPDGSDHRLRRASYRGPGVAYVLRRHECEARRDRVARGVSVRADIAVHEPRQAGRGETERVILLERGTRLSIR